MILGIVLVRIIQRDRISRDRITRTIVRVIQRDSQIYPESQDHYLLSGIGLHNCVGRQVQNQQWGPEAWKLRRVDDVDEV